jgi:asparagine synthase (glutamine-hydrolysing)
MARALQSAIDGPSSVSDSASTRLCSHVTWVERNPDAKCAAWNAARNILLVFNGRDFDIEEKARALRLRGHVFQTDAECLVRCYEDEGESFVSKLNGRFHGVLLDERTGKTLLFNDRFGAGRLYVHSAADGLCFASEAKALLAAFPPLRRIDQRGLGEYFSVGCVLQNRSLFTDISILPAGSLWSITPDGRIAKQRYFSPTQWEEQPALNPDEYCEQLTQTFAQIVPRYHRESGSVAMSMTGGLDSRMILAWAKAEPGQLPCYTFGGPYRDCADVTIARQLAALAKQPHHTIPIGNDFFAEFTALAERTVYLSDGTMDVSGAVELYANRLARTIAPIRLTGNYGSEILRANVAFRPRTLDTSLFAPEFRPHLTAAAETYRGEATGHRLSFIAFKQVPWHHHARLSIETAVVEPRSPFLDNALVALAYQAPAQLASSPLPALRTTAHGNTSFAQVATDRAIRLNPIPILSALAHRWQEFTAKAEYAYDYGMPPRLARFDQILKPLHLERLFLGRHKFYHFRIWYRDRLRATLGDYTLAASRQPACFREGAGRHLTTEHLAGKANHTLALHQLLTVQLTERALTTAPCPN